MDKGNKIVFLIDAWIDMDIGEEVLSLEAWLDLIQVLLYIILMNKSSIEKHMSYNHKI